MLLGPHIMYSSSISELLNGNKLDNSIISPLLLSISKILLPSRRIFVLSKFFYEQLLLVDNQNKNHNHGRFYKYIDEHAMIELSSFLSKGNGLLLPCSHAYDFDYIVVPLFLRSQGHWTVAIFDVSKKISIYYDSLGCERLCSLAQIEDVFDKVALKNGRSSINFEKEANNTNLQTGGVGSGVFVCLNSVLTCIGMPRYDKSKNNDNEELDSRVIDWR